MLRVKVDITENLGGSTLIHARTEDGHPLVMSSADRLAIGSGDTLPLSFSAVPHVFDKDGNKVEIYFDPTDGHVVKQRAG